MSLAYEFRQFLKRLRRDPSVGADKAYLDRLDKIAYDDLDGMYVALHAPVANENWEAMGSLPGTSDQSDPIPLRFPRPVQIVGMFPSLVDNNGVLLSPDLDDLLVSITANAQERFTTSQSLSTSAAGQQFITLSSIGVQVPRLWRMRLENAQPELTFIWRWKVPPVGGVAIFNDCLPSVVVYARYI